MSDADREEELELSRAPLIDHLIELRGRLINSLIALVIGFVIAFIFVEDIYAFLVQPYADVAGSEPGRRLIATSVQETFFTYIKLALWAGFIGAFPIIAWQLYAFIAPGLYKTERKAFAPYLVATPVLFIMGGALVYYMIAPLAFDFFLDWERERAATGQLSIVVEQRVSEYLSLMTKFILAFGICFQLPVAITLLARVGLVTSDGLKHFRRYAIVGTFLVAAFLTPPDPFSQLGLALPILLLYEISVYLARMVEKEAERALTEEDA